MAMHFHIASHCQTCTLRPPASLPPVHWAASPDTPATLEAVVEVAKFTYKKFGKFLKVGIQIPKFLWSCERPGWGLSRFNHPSYSTNGWRLCQRCCLKKSGWFSSEKKVPMMSHSTGWLKGDLYHHVYIYISPDHERNHHPANDLMLFNYIILRAFQERHVPNFRDVNPSGQVHKGFPWIPRRYRLRRQEGKQGLHIGVELRAVEMAWPQGPA